MITFLEILKDQHKPINEKKKATLQNARLCILYRKIVFKGGMGSKKILEPERKMEGGLNSCCRWSDQLDRRTSHRK